MDQQDEIINRIDVLEQSMREHTHSVTDSTSSLPLPKPVVQKLTDAATVTPLVEEDCVDITALAQAITIANPKGTPYNFRKLIIRIKDNGTARGITWGSNYAAGGTALPSTTILSKILHLGFIYNINTAKWMLVASAQEI